MTSLFVIEAPVGWTQGGPCIRLELPLASAIAAKTGGNRGFTAMEASLSLAPEGQSYGVPSHFDRCVLTQSNTSFFFFSLSILSFWVLACVFGVGPPL